MLAARVKSKILRRRSDTRGNGRVTGIGVERDRPSHGVIDFRHSRNQNGVAKRAHGLRTECRLNSGKQGTRGNAGTVWGCGWLRYGSCQDIDLHGTWSSRCCRYLGVNDGRTHVKRKRSVLAGGPGSREVVRRRLNACAVVIVSRRRSRWLTRRSVGRSRRVGDSRDERERAHQDTDLSGEVAVAAEPCRSALRRHGANCLPGRQS